MKKLIILLFSLLFIVSCTKPGAPAVDTTPVVPPDAAPAEQAQIGEAPLQPAADSQELLTDVMCVNDKISGIILNPTDKKLTLAKEIKVMINGLIVIDPECDSLVIEPGMTASCTDLSGHYPIRAGKVNAVKLNYVHKSVIVDVPCP